MLIEFFYALRDGGLRPSVTEFLTLLEAMQAHVPSTSVDECYYLARASLVKDERKFDRFDQLFAHYFEGVERLGEDPQTDIPADWLERMQQLQLSDEQKAQIEAMGGWDKLLQTLKQRLQEQSERHEGGSKWIGTAG